jgi:RND superfamily putative drug exporter
MFNLLGRLVITHPWKICAGWLAAALLLSLVAPAWHTKAQDDDICFLPDRCAAVRGYRLLGKAFPKDVFASRAVFAVERADGPLREGDFELVDACAKELRRLRGEEPQLKIGGITTYRDLAIGKRLVSEDRHCTLIQVSLNSPYLAEQTRKAMDRAEARLRRCLARRADAGPLTAATGPRLYATGWAGVGRDMNRACAESLDGTTLATILLVVVILLFVYRSPLLALVPLVTIALSVVVSLKILALTTLIPGVHLVNVCKVFAIVILYGAGTDYCLFLISRYREELEAGHDGATAVSRSIGGVGGALAASAGTVMCGLGLMVLAEFAKVRYGGPAIALSLGVALLASLTLAPALLHLLGTWAFWPRRVPHFTQRTEDRGQRTDRPLSSVLCPLSSGFWNRISRRVVARPVLVWGVAVAVLLPLALVGLRVQADYRATAELPPSSQSLQGLAALQRHFTAGETGPLTVLLVSPTPWDTPTGRQTIQHLSRSFSFLDNVAEVRSLTQPLGKALAEPVRPTKRKSLFGKLWQVVQPGVQKTVQATAQAAARNHYVATIGNRGSRRSVTRLDVVLKSDPFDPASTRTLGVLQTYLREELPRSSLPLGGVEAEVYGMTVNARDLAEITQSDRTRVNMLILAGIFLILLALVRRPWLAAYLLATVLLSYLATLGATALVGTLWSGRPLFQIDWRVPFFLFTILVAVGEDYNILLVTRVLQERSRYGTGQGIHRALARTGGTITSCGLIMAGTFATLMLAGLGTLKQIGFALAFGVLLDTFVVRPFLVPAFILVVWRQHPEVEKEDAGLPRLIGRSLRRAA